MQKGQKELKPQTNPNAPPNHRKIKVYLRFAVNFSGKQKVRDGSLTPDSGEIIFLGKLNNLEPWGADVGEAYTHEKLFIIAGAEFEELEGFILVFNKALYGLKSSGMRDNILASHKVREAIAAKIIYFYWIQSKYNPSDFLGKHCEIIKIFPMIKNLCITCGPITLIPRSAIEETPKLSN